MTRGPLAGLHALLVEQPGAARDILEAVLEAEGATVNAVASADEAMQLFSVVEFDVVITAIRLDEDLHNGLWLFEQIRRSRHGFRVPVIALTTGNPSALEHVGFAAVVVKPVDPLDIVALVIGVIGSRGA